MWPLYSNQKHNGRRRRRPYRQVVECLEIRALLTVPDVGASSYDTYLVLFDQNGASTAENIKSSADEFVETLEREFGEPVDVRFEYSNAIDAIAVWLTETQAAIVDDFPEVSDVLLDSAFKLQQNSAELTGAPQVWNGTAVSGVAGTSGEGVLIGIIDSGIDFDNASFAGIGPVDNYQHINPFGEETYLGVCDSSDPGFDESFICNDKVVGAYDFTDDTLINHSNFADHGTSVAGIAAGNFVSTTVPGTNQRTEISGVAPHANLISYDVCDSNDNCSSSAILAAVDQAIADGVDVINMSIGGPTENPWSSVMATAMWNAHNAGIFVAVSAGNEGPQAATLTAPADSPWVTAVAATDTNTFTTVEVDVVGTNVPVDLIGISALRGDNVSVANSLGPAEIVHVAGVTPGHHLGSFAYPADSLAGQIALIDRGDSLFETKVRNAWEAGAIGVVMINNVAGPLVTMAGVSQFPIPSVMISQQDGTFLRQWIADNPDTQLRINAEQSQQLTSVASFSSRGENEQADTLAPHIAAPGADTSVIAPVATGGVDQWDYFSGTSAASPHIAGAAALLTALHPNWSPSEIQSALQLTASSSEIVTGSALIAANAFDVGSGQVDVSAAANAGLILDETSQQFEDANPLRNGHPASLNLASFVNSNVGDSTSWTRTLKSTQSTTVVWTPVLQADDGMILQLDSSKITVSAGAEVTISLMAEISDQAAADWLFGDLLLVADADLPDLRFPIAVKPTPIPGVSINPSGSGTDTSEDGTTDTYTVQLLTDLDGLVQVEVNAPSQLEISSDGESFSSSLVLAIYDAFPRTITVRATNDDVAESTRLEQITHTIVETSSSSYPVSLAIDDADVRIFDNDIGQLQLEFTASPQSLEEGGDSVELTISRSSNSELSRPLSVALDAHTELRLTTLSGIAISHVEIPAGSSDVTILVEAMDNSVTDGLRTRQITVSSQSYLSATLPIDITDDDFVGIETFESAGSTVVTRSGSTDTFTVALRTQPTGNVVFDVASEDPNGVAVANESLTFTPDNWALTQTVTVTGLDDGNSGLVDLLTTITVVPTASATEYRDVSRVGINVSLVDADDSAPVILGPKGRTLQDPVTYRWTPVDGAESYDLYVERIENPGDPILEVTVADTFHVAQPQGIGGYRFWVRANFEAAASSAWIGENYQVSTSVNVAAVPDLGDTLRPQFEWESVVGATAYHIYISNLTTGQHGLFNLSNINSTSFTPDTDLTFGVYRVWARALGTNGFTADWSAPVDYFVGAELLSPFPSTFDTTPTFEWLAPDGAFTNEIFIRRPDGSSIVHSTQSESFVPNEPLQSGRHVWWVRSATESGQTGPWSPAAEIFIGGRTTLSDVGTTEVAFPTFGWDPVEGASEYEFYLNRTDIPRHILSVRSQSVSATPTLLPDGDYTAWVRPIDATRGLGFWSAPMMFTVQATQADLSSQPVNQHSVSFSNTPTLMWTANTEADSYEVYVNTGESTYHDTGIQITQWTTADLGEVTASWWVRAIDSAGRPGPWSSPGTIDTTARPVADAASISSNAAAFSWTPVEGSDRYVLQVDNLSTGQTRIIREEQLVSPFFETSSALPSGSYRFWVRAIRNANSSEGFWSLAVDFIVP